MAQHEVVIALIPWRILRGREGAAPQDEGFQISLTLRCEPLRASKGRWTPSKL